MTSEIEKSDFPNRTSFW